MLVQECDLSSNNTRANYIPGGGVSDFNDESDRKSINSSLKHNFNYFQNNRKYIKSQASDIPGANHSYKGQRSTAIATDLGSQQ